MFTIGDYEDKTIPNTLTMDVENKSFSEIDISGDSGKDGNSDDEVQEIVATTPSTKAPCTPVNGDSKSPKTPSTNSKKRKRLSSKEREEREKDRQEKRVKLEEEKQKKEEEKQRREEERKAKLQQKEEERIKREEEKLKREEEKRKKQEEDDLRKKEREEEKRVRDEEKKKKLEDEERKKKEKEEERLKKQAEKDQERIKREQEKQLKAEEKEREKKRDEEKVAKQAKMFQNFFQKSPATVKPQSNRVMPAQVRDDQQCTSSSDSTLNSDSNINSNVFKPMMFEVKSNMGLAPILRRSKLSVEETRDFDSECLAKGSVKNIEAAESSGDEPMDISDNSSPNQIQDPKCYLLHLKQKGGRKFCRTDFPSEPEIQIISNDIIENPKAQGLVKWRYKLLQFKENQRPAYWGTWKKLSTIVKARRPLAQEKEVDYDFDSDDEWEQEPEDAEDLANSDKEDDPDNDSEEDDEDGWLVPHGYVSDDEGANDEHLDKEDLKIKEKDYFDGLKKQIKILLPEIQTDRLAEFRIIFSPLTKKWKETCSVAAAAEKEATATNSLPVGLDDVIEID